MAESISTPAFEPSSSAADTLVIELESLRLDLIELAFVYDRRGRIDAADVATHIAGRIGRLLEAAAAAERREAELPENTAYSPLAR